MRLLHLFHLFPLPPLLPDPHRPLSRSYPLAVAQDGAVGPRPDMPLIPGFALSPLGCETYIPSIATS